MARKPGFLKETQVSQPPKESAFCAVVGRDRAGQMHVALFRTRGRHPIEMMGFNLPDFERARVIATGADVANFIRKEANGEGSQVTLEIYPVDPSIVEIGKRVTLTTYGPGKFVPRLEAIRHFWGQYPEAAFCQDMLEEYMEENGEEPLPENQ